MTEPFPLESVRRVPEHNGRYEYVYNGLRNHRHIWDVIPTNAPAVDTYTDEWGKTRTIYYDPARVQPTRGRFGHEWAGREMPGAYVEKLDDVPEGLLWRGMSDEEYQAAKQSGYFESNGSYNIGDEQKGLTFFSTGIDHAGNYANGFAPSQHKAGFGKPAHVVGIPMRPWDWELDHEKGIRGRIPFSDVTHHYVGHAYAIEPGEERVYDGDLGPEPLGGGIGSVFVQWEPDHPANPGFEVPSAEESWHHASRYFFAYSPTTYSPFTTHTRDVAPRPPGFVDTSDYDFTGSPETQYHHRQITPETLKSIEKRENNIDNYYEEMRQRREQGLGEIPWNEWLDRIAFIRNAMPITRIPPMNHFDEKLFRRQMQQLVYNDDEIDNGKPEWANVIRSQYMNAGKGPVDDYGTLITFIHHDEQGRPTGILHYFPHGSYRAGEQPGGVQIMVHPAHQGRGIGTKLLDAALSEFGVGSPNAEENKKQYNYEPIDLENQQYTPGGYELYQQFKNRTAMAWQDWADKVQNKDQAEPYGRYVIPEAGAFLDYRRGTYEGKPVVYIDGIYTHELHRNDGAAEALMRRLHEDHPGHLIYPGGMTQQGQAFHDRMLEKEPEAKAFVTANSLLVGPEDAYDEWDWFRRHEEHPPSSVDTEHETWYHVSPHHIPVGTTLAPMRGETPWNDDPYDHGLQNRANWIWVEFDKDKARAWMRYILQHHPEAWIYRVKPDVGPFAWNGTADEGWVTNRAEVLEELDQISRDLTFQERP